MATIYAGLLQANPNYRSVYYAAIESDQATPVVRVERHAGQMGFVRRVPSSRLEPLDDQELLAQITDLSPGDILLATRYQNKSAGKMRQEVSLLASTPVFDETTGKMFGLVTLEFDLLSRVVQVLERLEQSTAKILVTDAAGQAWVSDDPVAGITTMPGKIDSTTAFGVSELFTTRQHRIMEKNEGWVANRITLDPSNPQTTVWLILQLGDWAQ